MALPTSGAEPEAALCVRLEWDSRHFGFPIARVIGDELDNASAGAIDEWCAENGIRCLYLLADAEDATTKQIAAREGYKEVDQRITFRRSMEDVAELSLGGPASLEIRQAREEELGSLMDLAGRSHRATRFYADGGFPHDRCDELYRAWVERGLREPGWGLLVALVDGKPAGYEVFSGVVEGEGRGELAAVDERHRGLGIGRALHVAMFQALVKQGSMVHRSIVSGHNRPIIRIHERFGFTMDDAQVWHHRWYPG